METSSKTKFKSEFKIKGKDLASNGGGSRFGVRLLHCFGHRGAVY
jgi:hypothetical protein